MSNLEVVFATETVLAHHPSTGVPIAIHTGGHWPADDPIVLAYPKFFSADARYGLSSSDPVGEDGYPVRAESETSDAPPDTQAATETADATPGTKRRRGRADL